MFARVTRGEFSPDGIDELIRHVKDTTFPEAEKLRGWKGAYLLVNREAGMSLSVTLWESQEDLQASAEAANRLRAQAMQTAAAAQPPIVEVYEVAIQP